MNGPHAGPAIQAKAFLLPMISKYQVPQLFLGLFLRKMDVQDFRKMAETLPWRLPELDGQPRVAQNVPKDAKPDQARAAFMAQDGRKVLEVAPAKLQFRMLPGEVIDNGPNKPKGLKPYGLEQAFDEFIPMVMKIHNTFSEHYGASVNRIGVMVEMFAHLGASANQRMQQNLLASSNHFGERLQELNIQALSKPTLGADRQVNRWIRVRPLRSNEQQGQDLAMAVQVDINTPAEETYDLTATDIESFLKNVREHIETGIPLLQDASFFDQA